MNRIIDKYLGVDLDGDYVIISRHESGKESAEKITEFDLFNRRDLTDIVKESADCLPRISAIKLHYNIPQSKPIYLKEFPYGPYLHPEKILHEEKEEKENGVAIYIPNLKLLIINDESHAYSGLDVSIFNEDNAEKRFKEIINEKEVRILENVKGIKNYKLLKKENIELDYNFLLMVVDRLNSRDLARHPEIIPESRKFILINKK